jgi:hypothetical protein
MDGVCMAKCKLCKTNIPEGTEYCKNCLEKEDVKTNESYLDSLLDSVKNTAPTVESIYKKPVKKDLDNSKSETSELSETKSQEVETFFIDEKDIEDFDQFNIEDDLKDNINIESEDNNTDTKDNTSITEDSETKITEVKDDPMEPLLSNEDRNKEESVSTAGDINSISSEDSTETSDLAEMNVNSDDVKEFEEDEDFDLDLNNLLSGLDFNQNEQSDEKEGNASIEEAEHATDKADVSPMQKVSQSEQEATEDDEFLSLLNQISDDDPVADDVRAISDLISGKPVDPPKGSSTPSDVGEVFSDALKVVTNLNDPNLIADDNIKVSSDKTEKVKESKQNKNEKLKKENGNKTAVTPKVSLWKRLFGNVKDKKTQKKNISNVLAESASTNETSNKVKADKTGTAENDAEDETLQSSKDKKAAKKAAKLEAKKEKMEKKNKSKEVIEVIDEIDEDEGRINRLGASIVFVFFALLVVLIIAGTNTVSYSLSIRHASSYFDHKKYTEAYQEVYGKNIKAEDIELYDKIMTVMFVNKQLNSYNNYSAIREYPEALDSLLKGLKRYDKYIELAKTLGIQSDLDYVRNQILTELDKVYNVSEKQAIKINSSDDMKVYSLEVYDIVQNNLSNLNNNAGEVKE